MTRIALAVIVALITISAVTACYNKPPKESAPSAAVVR